MNLKFVKTDKCPKCGCDIIREERVETDDGKIRTHCNGGSWETREFACGYKVQYVPNYMKEEVLHRCDKDPEIMIRKYNKTKLKKDLIAMIEECNIEERDKVGLINNIKWG